MAQDSLSSTTQGIGNPGFLEMRCLDSTGAGNDAVVLFNPTYARVVNPQYAAFQHVNISVNGSVHIFEYSSNENLSWPVEFQNLPSTNLLTDPRELSMGYLDLLSFIRYSTNYAQSTFVVTSPDGYIETMRYMNGIDTMAESDAGQRNTAQRAQRWAGVLNFLRVLT